MSIRIQNPSTFALPARLQSDGVRLPVPHYRQEKSNWCWAACFQMVLNYLKISNASQCDIFKAVKGKPCVNETATAAEISRGWRQFGVAFRYYAARVSFGTATASIDALAPLEVGLRWSSGGGHVVIMTGYISSSTKVYVSDPGRGGVALMTYDYLASAYGKGSWTDTWNVLRRAS